VKLAMGLPAELCMPQENNTPLRNEHLTKDSFDLRSVA